MNKINLLDTPENRAVQKAAAEFFLDRREETFSGRNPELGKMMKCPVCARRHRSSHTCQPKYATVPGFDDEGKEIEIPLIAAQNTRFGVHGKANFKGRILRHRNAWGSQVLERATAIYNKEMSYYPSILLDDPDATEAEKKTNEEFRNKTGKTSLSRALNEKRKERADRRDNLNRISAESRRINRGA